MITKDAEISAPVVPAPEPAAPQQWPRKTRRAWDEAPRWQIYLPSAATCSSP
ncbi:hypothetical protein SAV31267_026340 [Streptomyces avermitilis]|uniref:Uncharacterized protein n=1 Tax=Streptomyces avermitilis TaxID=33903 RepID=A0A4D4MNW1_STRAX|nr:hypothetical protein SAV31267_026340 [Streptomyces avermitilis]